MGPGCRVARNPVLLDLALLPVRLSQSALRHPPFSQSMSEQIHTLHPPAHEKPSNDLYKR